MKLTTYKIYFLVCVFMMFSEGCAEKKDNKNAASQIELEQTEQPGNEGIDLSLNILNAYYDLKNALVESDFNLAKTKAKVLTDLLKRDNDTEDMIILAEAIAGAQSINDQRMEFDKLSREMYTLAKASKFHPAVIYHLYCPMAFNNKGAYWLSDKKETMNPYFGDSTIQCSRLEETISR